MKKKSHSSKLIVRMCLLIFTVYAIYQIIALNGQITEKQQQLEALDEQVVKQQLINEQLQESVDSEITGEMMSDVARDKLGYSMPGERIFIDITGQ